MLGYTSLIRWEKRWISGVKFGMILLITIMCYLTLNSVTVRSGCMKRSTGHVSCGRWWKSRPWNHLLDRQYVGIFHSVVLELMILSLVLQSTFSISAIVLPWSHSIPVRYVLTFQYDWFCSYRLTAHNINVNTY